MEEEWEPILLEIIAYKETGTYIMRSGDESAQQLDDHIVMTQAMSFSPYKKPFEARIMTWENKLRITQDVMEEWLVLYVSVCTVSVFVHVLAYAYYKLGEVPLCRPSLLVPPFPLLGESDNK